MTKQTVRDWLWKRVQIGEVKRRYSHKKGIIFMVGENGKIKKEDKKDTQFYIYSLAPRFEKLPEGESELFVAKVVPGTRQQKVLEKYGYEVIPDNILDRVTTREDWY